MTAVLLWVTLLVLLQAANVGRVQSATLKELPPLTDGLRRDRAGLLALRRSLRSFGLSSIKAGWSEASNSNPCLPPWPHLRCGANRVVAITLSKLGLEGTRLPDELADMDRLVTLDLSRNRIRATLPAAWGRKLSFVSLETLSLQGCLLYGTLPSWSSRGAWPKLVSLSLGANDFHGSLPTAWAGANTPFRRLRSLDLSDNYLGRQSSITDTTYLPLPEGTSDWGSGERFNNPWISLKVLDLSLNFFEGTLPTNWGKRYAYPSLETLDLQHNRLTGALPASWGAAGAFPRLSELRLAGNNLGDTDAPGGLPASWTTVAVPRALPSLALLVLYPGNEAVCAWLDGSVQSGATYTVVDESAQVYSAASGNTVLCPDPPADAPPTAVALSQAGAGQPLLLSWGASASYSGYMCGFRATVFQGSTAVAGPTDFQARPTLSAGLTLIGGTTYRITTSVTPGSAGTQYTAAVETLFCNGFESSAAASATYTSI